MPGVTRILTSSSLKKYLRTQYVGCLSWCQLKEKLGVQLKISMLVCSNFAVYSWC